MFQVKKIEGPNSFEEQKFVERPKCFDFRKKNLVTPFFSDKSFMNDQICLSNNFFFSNNIYFNLQKKNKEKEKIYIKKKLIKFFR